MGKIYTSYFANYRKFKDLDNPLKLAICANVQSYFVNSIDGIEPRLAPDAHDVAEYKSGLITAEVLTKRYNDMLMTKPGDINSVGSAAALDNIQELAKTRDVLLLCYEKSDTFCHRHVLRDYVKAVYKLDIQEL